MARKSARYMIFNELLIGDYSWFDRDDGPEESTFERGEEYFDYLAKQVVKMLKREGYDLTKPKKKKLIKSS